MAHLQLPNVGGCHLALDDQLVAGGRNLQELVARAQHTAQGGHAQILDDASHGRGDVGVRQHAFTLRQLVFLAGQFVFGLAHVGAGFLQILVAHRHHPAFHLGHRPLGAQHIHLAHITAFEQLLIHVEFALRQHQAVVQGVQLGLHAAQALLEQTHLRLHDARVGRIGFAKLRHRALHFGLQAQQGSPQGHDARTPFIKTRLGAFFLQRGQKLPSFHSLAFLHMQA